MKDAEIARGVLALSRGALGRIFHQVKLFHLRREQARAAQGDAQANEQDEDRRFGEEFAGIEPIEDQMNQRNSRTPLLENHVAFDKNLRNGAGHPFGAADQHFDFRTE